MERGRLDGAVGDRVHRAALLVALPPWDAVPVLPDSDASTAERTLMDWTIKFYTLTLCVTLAVGMTVLVTI